MLERSLLAKSELRRCCQRSQLELGTFFSSARDVGERGGVKKERKDRVEHKMQKRWLKFD